VLKLVFYVALIFSPFAAATAFIITYAEYSKHLIDRGQVRKRAWRAALEAFLFFLVVPPFLIWLFMGL